MTTAGQARHSANSGADSTGPPECPQRLPVPGGKCVDRLRSPGALLSVVHSSCFSAEAEHHPTEEPQDHQWPSVPTGLTQGQPVDMESHSDSLGIQATGLKCRMGRVGDSLAWSVTKGGGISSLRTGEESDLKMESGGTACFQLREP